MKGNTQLPQLPVVLLALVPELISKLVLPSGIRDYTNELGKIILPKRQELIRRSVINITTNPQLEAKLFLTEAKHGTYVSFFGRN